MADFDDVLERLLVDQQFRAALAANPAAALAGYRLTPDEVALLRSQVSSDAGGERTVEVRTSKASLFGLLGPIGPIGPIAPSGGAECTPPTGGFGATHAVDPMGAAATTMHSGFPGVHDMGQRLAETHHAPAMGDQMSHLTGGDAGHVRAAGFGSATSDAFGPTPHAGISQIQHAPIQHGQIQPGPIPQGSVGGVYQTGVGRIGDHVPQGYRPHIDADGDGHWDQYTAVQHADGSVDIQVDRNHDGVIDTVLHDRDHDGRIESGDYDEDFNGTYETYQRDTNRDGWLDSKTIRPDTR